MPYGTAHKQLVFTDESGNAFAAEEAAPGRPRSPFDSAWWTRFEFVMSTIHLDPEGTPVSVILEWVGDWDVLLNRRELLDALHGLGHPIAMQLQGSSSGASRWVVRPVPAGSRPRRPALCPAEP